MNINFINSYQRIFGTFPLRGDVLRQALEFAGDVGYRAYDTAQQYENETELGEFIASSGIPRSELCITTKVCPSRFDDESDFLKSIDESLKRLQIEQIDVLLLHWPPVGEAIEQSLKHLQKAYDKKLTKNIGISNYTRQMMHDAKKIVDAPIIVNQVEFHPMIDQSALLKGALETGIPLSSYCSLARAEVPKNKMLADIGKTYGKTGSQVALRWILQKGVPIITMSTKLDNIKANFDVMDFTLSNIDIDKINALMATNYRVISLEEAPWAPRWDTPTPRENRPAAVFTG
ncbi:MAG: aldo/keto reductase [Alphaproteobacteria bacterium]|nr:aldo/keto reductase [Alphaproteobacteria bacterium]